MHVVGMLLKILGTAIALLGVFKWLKNRKNGEE